MPWTEIETSTHHDHVVKHVLGATVLGWFVSGDAAYFVLDIGLLWTVYVDGEMNLLPQGFGIAELEGDEFTGAIRTELAAEADLLSQKGRDVQGLKRLTAAPVECLISSVEVFAKDDRRMIMIQGESAGIKVECSMDNGEVNIATS
ncbi:MAG: hypothetical protein ACXW18_11415 [Pyrinomonadaceae bacterium]